MMDSEHLRSMLGALPPAYKELADQGPVLLPRLQQVIDDHKHPLSPQAAYLAGVIGTAISEPVLSSAAEHPSARVRMAVAFVLPRVVRQFSEDQIHRILVPLLADDNHNVTFVAVRSAAAIGSDVLMRLLEGIARDHPAAHVREEAARPPRKKRRRPKRRPDRKGGTTRRKKD